MSHIITCPGCSAQFRVSEQIIDKTLICPRCLAEVDNPQPGFQIRASDINTDVKRDLSTISFVLTVLIGLCVLGIVIAFFLGLHARGMGGEKGLGAGIFSLLAITTCFGVLDVLVSIAIIRALIRRGSSGRIVGIVFLSLGSIVAVVIFFGFACGGLVFIVGK